MAEIQAIPLGETPWAEVATLSDEIKQAMAAEKALVAAKAAKAAAAKAANESMPFPDEEEQSGEGSAQAQALAIQPSAAGAAAVQNNPATQQTGRMQIVIRQNFPVTLTGQQSAAEQNFTNPSIWLLQGDHHGGCLHQLQARIGYAALHFSIIPGTGKLQ